MKKYLIPTVIFVFLGGLLISVKTGIPESFWQDKKNPLQNTETIHEEGEKLGFLYLQYVDIDHGRNMVTYDVSIFYPDVQKIKRISKIVLQSNFDRHSLNYSNGKIIYQISKPKDPYRDIIVLDIKTGQTDRMVRASSITPSQNRKIESYLITQNFMFFLDCIAGSSGVFYTSSDCRLNQISLHEVKKAEVITLLNLSDIVEEIGKKTIERYYPKRNSLILRNWLNYDIQEPPDWKYYEVPLDEARVKPLTEGMVRQVFKEIAEIDQERCRTSALESKVLQNERSIGVEPPVSIGCFNLKELESLSQ